MKTMVITAQVPDAVAELLAKNNPEEWAQEFLGGNLECAVADWWPRAAARLGVSVEGARESIDVLAVHFEDAAAVLHAAAS
jgi:hypothetical protein